MTLAAALLAAAAVALISPAPGRSLAAASTGRIGRRRPPFGPALICVLVGAGAVLVVLVDGLRLALALVILGTTAAGASLVARSRRTKAAETRQARVVQVAEALAGELRAGQPPLTSLEHCVDMWPAFGTVVAAARLGADVPSALRRMGRQPGAEGLREVASAWQVSERSGAGLATALSQVADTARARQATRRLVQGELASAQATARLVAGLPVLSLAMSAGIGGDPWHFLLATGPGLVCLGLGSVFAFAGLLWIDRIAVAVLRG
ncbi:MAG TPA: type II secretion system F family protein [Nocardioidaceae bacterium]|nr:type II secretion system F family protein [Nocardioidaceae bacterium]